MGKCKQCGKYDRDRRTCTLYDECVEDTDKCAGFCVKVADMGEDTVASVLSKVKAKKQKSYHKRK